MLEVCYEAILTQALRCQISKHGSRIDSSMSFGIHDTEKNDRGENKQDHTVSLFLGKPPIFK